MVVLRSSFYLVINERLGLRFFFFAPLALFMSILQ